MENTNLLIVAMAQQCRALIEQSQSNAADLPQALHRNHLLWMCDRIEREAEEWSVTKQHRWIGFIQAGMLANRMLSFDTAKSMFDKAKNAYEADEDLLDHLDPTSEFEFDIGGEG